jgi:hypothetical protein
MDEVELQGGATSTAGGSPWPTLGLWELLKQESTEKSP